MPSSFDDAPLACLLAAVSIGILVLGDGDVPPTLISTVSVPVVLVPVVLSQSLMASCKPVTVNVWPANSSARSLAEPEFPEHALRKIKPINTTFVLIMFFMFRNWRQKKACLKSIEVWFIQDCGTNKPLQNTMCRDF